MDKKSWSGTHFFIREALQKHCGDVTNLGPVSDPVFELFGKIVSKIASWVWQRNVNFRYLPFITKRYARILEKRLINTEERFDILFFPSAGVVLADFKTDIPVISLYDATAFNMMNYYGGYKNLVEWSAKEVVDCDIRAVRNSDAVIYASAWAAESAIANYGDDQDKFNIVPFGANGWDFPEREFLLTKRKKESLLGSINVLFIGMDWERKGGQIAVDTVSELNKRGVNSKLTICGIKPPDDVLSLPFVNYKGVLDKNVFDQYQRLIQCYLEATFFVFPSRQECAGIVLCEAAAMCLPSIAADTGGISTYVAHNITGKLVSLEQGGSDYADEILSIYSNSDCYMKMCEAAREKYDLELNWDVWGQRTRECVEKILMSKVVA